MKGQLKQGTRSSLLCLHLCAETVKLQSCGPCRLAAATDGDTETHAMRATAPTCSRPSKGCICCCGLSGCALNPPPPSGEKGLNVSRSCALL